MHNIYFIWTVYLLDVKSYLCYLFFKLFTYFETRVAVYRANVLL